MENGVPDTSTKKPKTTQKRLWRGASEPGATRKQLDREMGHLDLSRRIEQPLKQAMCLESDLDGPFPLALLGEGALAPIDAAAWTLDPLCPIQAPGPERLEPSTAPRICIDESCTQPGASALFVELFCGRAVAKTMLVEQFWDSDQRSNMSVEQFGTHPGSANMFFRPNSNCFDYSFQPPKIWGGLVLDLFRPV